jgi:hypothetical protein
MCRLSTEVSRANRIMFKTRFKEHIRDVKNSGQNSKFAQKILYTKHEYEIMEKTMKKPTYRKARSDAGYL